MYRHTEPTSRAISGPASWLLAALCLIVGGCGTVTPAPPPRPSAPTDWLNVVSGGKDLRLTLPPYLQAFDTTGAIFANEPPVGNAGFLQLLAEGPRTAMPQPGQADRLEDWLEAHLASAGPGTGTYRTVELPAGRAVMIDRVVRGGTPDAWRLMAFAIRTRSGVAYLLIDGPLSKWAGREADIALISMLAELGPGS